MEKRMHETESEFSLDPPGHWAAILDMFHNGVLILDRSGMIKVYNKAARRIFGEDRLTSIGRHIQEVRPGVWPEFQHIIETGQPQFGRKISIAGTTVIANRSPILFDGQVQGVISVFQDISEYEIITSELQSFRRLTRELEAIIESSYDGLYITDGKANTIRVNRAYERITGLCREDLIGRNMNELVQKNVFDHSVTLEVLKKREPVTIMQVVTGDKQVIVTGTPIIDEDGEIVLVVTNVRNITELNRLKMELEDSRRIASRMAQTLLEQESVEHAIQQMVIKSQSMMKVVRMAIKVAGTQAPVLLQGESGVGKSMLARIIHQISDRKERVFLKINCGTIPPTLMESELFGYEKGAFTGAMPGGKAGMIETAHMGTVFLDEVAELRPDMQVKLLEIIEDKTFTRVGGTRSVAVDVRVIAATNRDLMEMIRAGGFREDLYYRLNVVPISIPPLRQRREDIMPLVMKVMESLNRRNGTAKKLESGVMDRLLEYTYPGNVRELINIIERMMIMSEGERLCAEDLPEETLTECGLHADTGGSTLRESVQALEKRMIRYALDKTGSLAAAADFLDVHPTTLWRKMARYSIAATLQK
ncbi:MAG: PAS domain S-box protein [Desulfobacteraceae bacterium]|nr:MAG: PAS domain S-box protein [Desulfobacteraceae bacterium]